MFKRVFIIVDALDECCDEMMWELMDSLRCLGDQVNLLVTSRSLETIQNEVEDFDRPEIKANKADLEISINKHIQKNRNLRRIVGKSPLIEEDIKIAVVRIAEEYTISPIFKHVVTHLIKCRFLLARLHVKSLGSAAELSIKHARKRSQSLPTTLNGTYDEAMQRIEAQGHEHRQIAVKTLAWISYAFRPLELRQL